MRKLSIGTDSTLGEYRRLTLMVFGHESAAVEYLDKLIAESKEGVNEEVIVAESQMLHLLGTIHNKGSF